MIKSQNKYLEIIIVFILLGSITSCSKYITKDIERGTIYKYEYGIPTFTINAIPRIVKDSATISKLSIGVVKNSLIYKIQGEDLMSSAEVVVEIDKQKAKVIPLILKKGDHVDYYDHESLIIEEVLELKPGSYDLSVTIYDNNSHKKKTKTLDLYVPDPVKKQTYISNVSLYQKTTIKSDYQAINIFDVNAGYDSLKFEYQIVHSEDVPIKVTARLLRFETDKEIPRRLSDRNYRKATLEYEGIDYGSYKVVQTTKREINSAGNIIMEYYYGSLPEGNYRFEAITESKKGRNYRARDFSIKGDNYPSLKNANELAEPLAYLMKKDEYKKILSMQSSNELMKSIERFWLNKIHNKAKARNVLQLYYERVEQANRLYSNFQEGWKTDPGMIYILFGPPLYIEHGFGEMTWFYTFDSGTKTPHIYFKDVQYGNNNFPFQHFVLKRSPELFNLEYKQIQAWHDGTILHMHQM